MECLVCGIVHFNDGVFCSNICKDKYECLKLFKLKQTHKKQLNNIVKNLNRIINDIREYIPDANIFLNGESGVTLNVHSKDQGNILWEESLVYSVEDSLHYTDCGGY